MMRKLMLSVLAAGLFALAAPAVRAEDQPKDKGEGKASAAELLAAAAQLADFGEKHKSHEALIAAGALVKRAMTVSGDVKPLDVEPKVLDEKGKPTDAKAGEGQTESLLDIADGYFAAARTMGKDSKMPGVEALIIAARARKYEDGSRSPVGGTKIITRTLQPKQQHEFAINFLAGIPGNISFSSDNAARCEMKANNYTLFNAVVRTGSYTWTPKDAREAAKPFIIKITNSGNQALTYRLIAS